MVIATFFSLGILADRLLAPPIEVWIGLAWGGWMVGLLHPSRRIQILWATTTCVAAAWNADRARLVPADDIHSLTRNEPVLARVVGTVVGEVVTVEPDPIEASLSQRQEVRARWTLSVRRVEGVTPSVSGKVLVHLAGGTLSARAGDPMSVLGWLVRPSPPANQGEADYAAYLQDQGIGGILYTEGAEGIERPPTESRAGAGWLDALRGAGSQLLHARLSNESARLAEAFLLGIRSSLHPNEVLPFIESGTIHVLVVSGLHVALLSHLCWLTVGPLIRSVSVRGGICIAVVLLYTLVTGANPPAVRAAVVAILVLGQFLVRRTVDSLQMLAASMLVVLLIDPADLFRTGPQLSFLCAVAIVLFLQPASAERQVPEDALSRRRPWTELIFAWGRPLVIGCLVLWLMTAPLLASTFHLFSPVSVLASLFLVPISEALLGVGVLFLSVGWLPIIGPGIAWVLDLGMAGLAWTSRQASLLEAGSLYCSGPADWWVMGWYLFFLFPWVWPVIRPLTRWHLWTLAVWGLIGVGDLIRPTSPSDTRYHQLAVGHGNAGILQTRAGQTVLFDAGSTRGPDLASRIVASWLWHHRVGRVDALFLSHADIDHFNGVVRLARRFSIGQVFIPRQFVESPEPGVSVVLEDLWRRGIPIRFLWKNDQVDLGDVQVHVWHPPVDFQGKSDNAESLVLAIESQGRTILQTGDVEADGLKLLLEQPNLAVDVLIAPHHGSTGSNTLSLAEGARPEWVISSQARERRRVDSLEVYRRLGAQTLSTDQSGEVAIRLGSSTRLPRSVSDPTSAGDSLDVRSFLKVPGLPQINRRAWVD
jgi:competence protein ComEC